MRQIPETAAPRESPENTSQNDDQNDGQNIGITAQITWEYNGVAGSATTGLLFKPQPTLFVPLYINILPTFAE